MEFSSTPGLSLAGATQKALSKAEVLAAAAEQRKARQDARRAEQAARSVQRAFRGARARAKLRAERLDEWLAEFGVIAASGAAKSVSGEDARRAVRLLLAVLLPPPASAARVDILQGGPLVSAPEPQQQHQQQQQRRALAALIALLSRSVKSADPDTNYLAGGDLHGAQRLVLLLCAAIAAPPSADTVLDAAASRLLELLLLDVAAPAPPLSAGGEGAAAAAQEAASSARRRGLFEDTARRPVPFMAAARRAADRVWAGSQSSGGSSSGSHTGGGESASHPAQFADISNASVMTRLAGLAVALSDPATAGSGRDEAPQPSVAMRELVRQLLTSPGLVTALPASVCARMLQPAWLSALLAAAEAAGGGEGAVSGPDAAALLGNLCHLLLGTPGSVPATDVLRLPPSPHLNDCKLAAAFCRTFIALITAAAAAASAGKAPSNPRDAFMPAAAAQRVRAQLALLGAQAPLVQLLSALSDAMMPLYAGTCLHLVIDLPVVADALTGAQASRLLTAASDDGAVATAADVGSPALNALAFSPAVLPAMWRWLATNLGVPLEAPAGARLGLDVAAVSGGARRLRPEHALALGVFCRVLSQLLLVLSDDDLHARGEPFSTAAARAIATTLNTLVYCGCFPRPPQPQQQQQQHQRLADGAVAPPNSTLMAGCALLERAAPTALRGLYDRDQRRPFCQPALWTAPFDADAAAAAANDSKTATAADAAGGGSSARPSRGHSGLRAAAAVVQGLLLGGNHSSSNPSRQQRNFSASAADGARGGTAGATSPSPTPGSSSGSGGSPAAMAALLRVAPQCVPFDARVQLFRQLLAEDRARGRWNLAPAEGGPRPLAVTVRRATLLEDAFAGLARAGDALKGRLHVTFISEAGLPEAGIDHGGLTKELVECALRRLLAPGYGLFAGAPGSSGLACTSPAAEAVPGGLALLEFAGALAAKALYEGMLVDLALAPPLVLALQGRRPGADDLAGVDAALAAGLAAVRGYAGNVADLGLTFCVDVERLGATRTVDLIPNGASTPVTRANRALYCHLLAGYYLNERLGRPAAAFAAGMARVLPLPALRLFSPAEFNQLLSGGADGGLEDLADWKAHTAYGNGYKASSRAVRLFWEVVEEMAPSQRGALLRFVTSCGRAPLGGFKHLTPPFTVQRAGHGPGGGGNALAALLMGPRGDLDALPSASTCFNMLKLPPYATKRALREKLLLSIESGAGFELS